MVASRLEGTDCRTETVALYPGIHSMAASIGVLQKHLQFSPATFPFISSPSHSPPSRTRLRDVFHCLSTALILTVCFNSDFLNILLQNKKQKQQPADHVLSPCQQF